MYLPLHLFNNNKKKSIKSEVSANSSDPEYDGPHPKTNFL